MESKICNTSKTEIIPPGLRCNSAESLNPFDSFIRAGNSKTLSSQERKLASILKKLQNVNIPESNSDTGTS